ncbi:MAG: outer membrane beta-barrel family protein, partial [Balneolaceae bacterium]
AYSNGSGALRGLSANMIEEVEVITNPSARYEAEGSAGIINIILKKNEDKGFNGNVAAGAGHPTDYEISSNLNYRTNNINWFLNTSVDYRADPRSSRSYQRYSSADTSYIYRQRTNSEDWEVDGNIRVGADFYLSYNQTMTISSTLDMENGEDEREVNYTDLTINEEVIEEVRRFDLSEEKESDFEFEIQYENIINEEEDHKLTADFDIDFSRESEYSNLRETVEQVTGEPLLQRTDNRESEIDYRFRADYERPLSDVSKMEAGINSSYEYLENTFAAEEKQNNEWMVLDTFNDNFTYNEIVNAAYGIFSTRFGKFSTQLGLRLEQTIIDTELKSTSEGSKQNYLQLFPSVFLNYEFNEQQSVQTSYSRRIRRPWSRMLLPFSSFSDSRTQSTGNPNLKPEFGNSYDVGFLQYWETGSLLTSVYYRHTVDEFERITRLDDDGITRRLPINLSTEKSWGLEFSMDQDLFDVITLNANANFYQSNSEGSYENQDFSSETETFFGRLGLRWDIMDGLRYQAYMRYRGPRNTTQGRRPARTSINTGFAYEMMDGRALASFSVRDLLNSRSSNWVVEDPNFYSEQESLWNSRSFMLNFTWYFNREKGE